MITYPNKDDKFTIYEFRSNGGERTADYYLHVVNDKTGVCLCLFQTYSFETAMNMYETYKKECKKGWHIELTVGIYTGEGRARIK